MRIIFLLLITPCFLCFSQETSLDSLSRLGDEELLDLFNEVEGDTIKQELVARHYLQRGRDRKDTIMMARGYDRLARVFEPEKNLMFADSVIALTEDMNHMTYPAMGYILKSIEYDYLNDLPKSTENLYLGYNYASQNKNLYLQLYALDYLITNKSFWGNKKDALELQKFRHSLVMHEDLYLRIKESSRVGYYDRIPELVRQEQIASLFSFIQCYVNLENYETAEEYLSEVEEELIDFEGFTKSAYDLLYIIVKMEIEFLKEDYDNVLKIERINNLSKIDLKSYFFDYNYFLGLTYMKIDKAEKGLSYLRRADSFYEVSQKQLLPYQRKAFTKLLDHYEEKNDVQGQLRTYKNLLKIDSTFKQNYKFFEPDMILKFETPRLLAEKEAMISGLQERTEKSRTMLSWGLGMLILTTLGLLYYFNRQLIYKKRFNALQMNGINNAVISPPNESHQSISSDVVEHIMEQLEQFEEKQTFLTSNIHLNELSKSFNTNSNYLSRVINLKMGKNFSQYINDLRVEYALAELKENNRFRKYTIKAIANECGFNTAESFNKAFYKRHGIYPSYFIKMIEKET